MTVSVSEVMQQSGVAFGTSGARGLASQLTDRVAYLYALGFLTHLEARFGRGKRPRVVVGGDLRPSTPRIVTAVSAASASLGYEVISAGFVPSPAVALRGLEVGAPSMMVTGSHIPADRNGIKFNRHDGEIDKEDERGIRQVALALDERLFGSGGESRMSYAMPAVDPSVRAGYLQRWLDFFPQGCLRGMKVGVYQHSTVGRELLVELLQALGAEVMPLGFSDSFVPVDTEALRLEDIELARGWAQQHPLDAIVSADGDCDRPLLADERGEWLRGDVLGVLCARALGAVGLATPVSCNTLVERCEAFAHIRRTRIGSPYVIAAMQELQRQHAGLIVGFEANGGFLQQSALELEGRHLPALPTRDAVLPVVTTLLEARAKGGSISQLVACLPPRFTASGRVQDFPTEQSQQRLADLAPDDDGSYVLLQQALRPFGGQVEGVDVTDGLRTTFVGGRVIHLRASGNAPEMRCYIEAETPEAAADLCEEVLRELARWKS